jgi:hypothetical protein
LEAKLADHTIARLPLTHAHGRVLVRTAQARISLAGWLEINTRARCCHQENLPSQVGWAEGTA